MSVTPLESHEGLSEPMPSGAVSLCQSSDVDAAFAVGKAKKPQLFLRIGAVCSTTVDEMAFDAGQIA